MTIYTAEAIRVNPMDSSMQVAEVTMNDSDTGLTSEEPGVEYTVNGISLGPDAPVLERGYLDADFADGTNNGFVLVDYFTDGTYDYYIPTLDGASSAITAINSYTTSFVIGGVTYVQAGIHDQEATLYTGQALTVRSNGGGVVSTNVQDMFIWDDDNMFELDGTGTGTASETGNTAQAVANIQRMVIDSNTTDAGAGDTNFVPVNLTITSTSGATTMNALQYSLVFAGDTFTYYLQFGATVDISTITAVTGKTILAETIDGRLYSEFNMTTAAKVTTGTANDDKLIMGFVNDDVSGGNGNDLIYGENGNDILKGEAGDDTLSGGEGNDTLNGGDDNDVLSGGLGDDTLDGGTGIDTATYFDASRAVEVYLQFSGLDTGGGGIDTFSNIENLTGSIYNDRLIGDAGNNTLTGGAGNDIIKGKGGNDTFYGDDGDDTLTGSDGDDIMYGGAGNDILSALGGNDTLNGGDGDDFVYGGRDNDTLNGDAGVDNLRGNLGLDVINGGDGSDTLRGGGQNDILNGDAGNDFLFGENHSDILYGGAGDDSLSGGSGGGIADAYTDTFVYVDTAGGGGGFDRIKDFDNGTDLIDLQSFAFANFAAVQSLASDTATGLRINFGGGDVLFVENFLLTDFDATDVLL